ncbi:MAG: hypothetical protein HY966_06165 [Ignavibacteriales bacterium]|nr:hypothetical protein [Ignavibacteriales bacterium]
MPTEAKQDQTILRRLEELRDVIQTSRKVLPLFDNFLQFVKEIVPMIEGLNHSLDESASKLPKASTELHNVSKATETATIAILDTLDAMGRSLDEGTKLAENLQQRRTNGAAVEEQEHGQWSQLQNTFHTLSDQVGSITITLQVQDITSQQLAAVNHLVKSVYERLSWLMNQFEVTDLRSLHEEVKMFELPQAFDPNASWEDHGTRQSLADDLVRKTAAVAASVPRAS